LSVRNHTYRVARHAELLAVHLIGDGQRDLAELFASTTGDEIDKFARCDWSPGAGGVPVLAAASGWFAGIIVDRSDVGDHAGFLLAPVAGASNDDSSPLMLSALGDLAPGHSA
jgi:flavin reductase (DIM6/NTAB) family NADH-FMN oxidoreductase RutF